MRAQAAVRDEGVAVRSVRRGLAWLPTLALAAVATQARPLRAQDQGGDGGYLLHTPTGTLTLRTGYDFANANSDVFTSVMDQLTLTRSDFSSPTIATDLAFRLSPQVDAEFGLGYSRSAAQSQFRGWLDNNNMPIQQSTELTRVPLTVNLKAYLQPRGQAIGRFAWVPARVAPYVGVGAGTMHYRFRQGGDFVDTVSTNVFPAVLSSSGWTPMADGFAGADFNINPSMAFNAEARYSWAQGQLGGDFSGFHRIDLSGVAITAGLIFRF
jgi:opacity protein-like surface antigen